MATLRQRSNSGWPRIWELRLCSWIDLAETRQDPTAASICDYEDTYYEDTYYTAAQVDIGTTALIQRCGLAPSFIGRHGAAPVTSRRRGPFLSPP